MTSVTKKNNIVVIKIGSNVLTTKHNQLDLNYLRELSRQLSTEVKKKVFQFIIVTSGAITCGSERMILNPKTIPEKQAAAAVGQILLMEQYIQFFEKRGCHVAQILLTKNTLRNDAQKQHTKNTLHELLARSIIPIINENDTVSTEELDAEFGDNDILSSRVAELVQAKLLILFTDTDGLYTSNPKNNASAVLVKRIQTVTKEIIQMTDASVATWNKGGMRSKIKAAQYAQEKHIEVVIANGKKPNIIKDILNKKPVGTRLLKKKHPKKAS